MKQTFTFFVFILFLSACFKIQEKTCSVSFNSKGGSFVPTQTISYGSKINKPDNPIRDGFVFEKWCGDSSYAIEFDFNRSVIKDSVLYAKWKLASDTVKTFVVIFNSNGGSSVSSKMVTLGATIEKPINPTKSNFIFDGWYIDPLLQTPFDFLTSIIKSTTLYAKWKDPNVMLSKTITYNSNGGSAIPAQLVLLGLKAVKPRDPIFNDFVFKSWYSDAGLTRPFDFRGIITKDTFLYAKWEVANHIVANNLLISNLTENFWNQAFPNRAGNPYTTQGYYTDFYSLANFKQAVREFSLLTVVYVLRQDLSYQIRVTDRSSGLSWFYEMQNFSTSTSPIILTKNIDCATLFNESNSENNKRELMAFLANTGGKETNAGTTIPIGGGQEGDKALWGFANVFETVDGHSKMNCSLQSYVQISSDFPSSSGKCYHGRGPILLTGNLNYGQFSSFNFRDKNVLLNNPDQLSEDPVLAFKSAFWLWMLPKGRTPSSHDIMQNNVDVSSYTGLMSKKGFGHVVNVLNGRVECRSNSESIFVENQKQRADYYRYYLQKYGYTQSQIDAENTSEYSVFCYLSANQTMSDY